MIIFHVEIFLGNSGDESQRQSFRAHSDDAFDRAHLVHCLLLARDRCVWSGAAECGVGHVQACQ